MSNFPAIIKMRITAQGHGGDGMVFRRFEDSKGLDIMLAEGFENDRAPFKQTWRYRWLPGGEFASYDELRAAVAALTPQQIAAEKAQWPKLIEPPEENGGECECWFHTDRNATHIGQVQISWHEDDSAPICAECADVAKTDPNVIVRAIDKRRANVAERRAKAMGKGSNP